MQSEWCKNEVPDTHHWAPAAGMVLSDCGRFTRPRLFNQGCSQPLSLQLKGFRWARETSPKVLTGSPFKAHLVLGLSAQFLTLEYIFGVKFSRVTWFLPAKSGSLEWFFLSALQRLLRVVSVVSSTSCLHSNPVYLSAQHGLAVGKRSLLLTLSILMLACFF